MVAIMPKFDPLVFLKTISEQKLGRYETKRFAHRANTINLGDTFYLLLICLYILIYDHFSTNIVCPGFLPLVPPLIIFLLEYKELVDKYDLTSVKVSATFDPVQLSCR